MKIKKLLFALLICCGIVSCNTNKEPDASGTFEATVVTVSAEMNGKIVRMDIEEGTTIAANETVGCLDTTQLCLQRLMLEQQQQSVNSSQPNVDTQTATFRQQLSTLATERKRIENMLHDGAATQKQLDDIIAQQKLIESQMAATTSTLSDSRNAISHSSSVIDIQKKQIDDQISRCHIKSPITGVILQKYVQTGEVVGIGKPIFKVADMDNVYLRAYFSSDRLQEIKLGQKVMVTAQYGDGKKQVYEGTVSWISSESQFTPKNIQTDASRGNLVYAVKIKVKNDGKIKLGFYGEVNL